MGERWGGKEGRNEARSAFFPSISDSLMYERFIRYGWRGGRVYLARCCGLWTSVGGIEMKNKLFRLYKDWSFICLNGERYCEALWMELFP